MVAGSSWFAINGGKVDTAAAVLAGFSLLMLLVQFKLIPCRGFRRPIDLCRDNRGSHGQIRPPASRQSRQLRAVRPDRPVYRVRVATERNAPVPSQLGSELRHDVRR